MEGLTVHRGRPGQDGGVFLCDADDEADLMEIATSPALSPPVLWCGSAGLARALARPGTPMSLAEALPPPRLLLVGTAHPVTLAQLERLDPVPPAASRLLVSTCRPTAQPRTPGPPWSA